MPAALDHSKHGAKQPREKAASAEKKVQIFLYIGLATPHFDECLIDGAQDEQVRDCDSEKKQCRDGSPDETGNILECFQPVLKFQSGSGNCCCAENDNRRMSE